MESARTEENLNIFGTPLMLCTMAEDFNFNKVPDFKFKVWATLLGLQLELWQPSTIAIIVSMVETPVEVDHHGSDLHLQFEVSCHSGCKEPSTGKYQDQASKL